MVGYRKTENDCSWEYIELKDEDIAHIPLDEWIIETELSYSEKRKANSETLNMKPFSILLVFPDGYVEGHDGDWVMPTNSNYEYVDYTAMNPKQEGMDKVFRDRFPSLLNNTTLIYGEV